MPHRPAGGTEGMADGIADLRRSGVSLLIFSVTFLVDHSQWCHGPDPQGQRPARSTDHVPGFARADTEMDWWDWKSLLIHLVQFGFACHRRLLLGGVTSRRSASLCLSLGIVKCFWAYFVWDYCAEKAAAAERQSHVGAATDRGLASDSTQSYWLRRHWVTFIDGVSECKQFEQQTHTFGFVKTWCRLHENKKRL